MTESEVMNMLDKLGKTKEIELCLLIEKNGDIIGSGGEDVFVHLETIAMMSATTYGAATTANKQLEKDSPDDILINDSDGYTIIKPVDKSTLLVARTTDKESLQKAQKSLKIAKKYVLKYF